MASNMNFKANLQIDTSFDSNSIAKGLQEIRKQMGNLSVDQSIFKNVDKEFVKLQSLLNTLQAQQKNVTSPVGLNAYQRTLERVRESAQRIGIDLKDIAQNNNKAFNFKSTVDLNSKIEQLNKNLNIANNDISKIRDQMALPLSNLGFNDEEISKILDKVQNGSNLLRASTDIIGDREKQINQLIQKRIELEQKSKNITISANDEIKSKGTYSTKTAAEAGVTKTIRDSLATSYANNETSDQALKRVREEIAKSKVELNDYSRVWDNIVNKYTELISQKQKWESTTGNISSSTAKISSDMQKLIAGTPSILTHVQSMAPALQQSATQADQLKNSIVTTTNKLSENSGQKELTELGVNAEKATNEMHQLVDEQQDLATAQKEVNSQQMAMNAAFDRVGSAVKNILSIGNAWRQVNRVIRQTFQDIQRLDSAFASIAMVTDYQVSDLWDSYSDYSEIANRLGQTTEGAIKSSALFFQQGGLNYFNMQD